MFGVTSWNPYIRIDWPSLQRLFEQRYWQDSFELKGGAGIEMRKPWQCVKGMINTNTQLLKAMRSLISANYMRLQLKVFLSEGWHRGCYFIFRHPEGESFLKTLLPCRRTSSQPNTMLLFWIRWIGHFLYSFLPLNKFVMVFQSCFQGALEFLENFPSLL